MASPSRRSVRAGAAVVVVSAILSGCTATSFRIPPETILSAVIANLPRDESSGGSSRPSSRPSSGRRIPPSPAPSAGAARLLRSADDHLGVRYKWGGNTPKEGFDCSGFTKYIFARHGATLPRTAREQVRSGSAVARDFGALVPGDLMFFAEPGEAISHVAIYAGNGRILHASSALGEVGYTDLNTGGEWYVAYFVAARRLGL